MSPGFEGPDQILVCNCGSSSLKVDVFRFREGVEEQPASVQVERIGSAQTKLIMRVGPDRKEYEPGSLDHASALELVTTRLDEVGIFRERDRLAVGHRVVHGGHSVRSAMRIGPELIGIIESCVRFAPLHNPANLEGIRAAEQLFAVPQVGVFDTAFHADLPAAAHTYALPSALIKKHQIRRYGFHGPSHQYVATEAARILGRPLFDLRLITLHLGNGASACAIQNGQSIDTSMGFTPLEGLVMGTRCGDLDPALVSFLMSTEGLTAEGVDALLNRESGLLGLGGHRDMRDLLAAAQHDPAAALARDVFCYRIRKYIGAYWAALGGLEALVFTAGIGENSPEIRAGVLGGMQGMGITLDPALNAAPPPNGFISAAGSLPVLVVPTDEELMIARQTLAVVSG